ncbi:MAG: hypothetical protein R2794_02115 [Chitinophagales bacterium]
MSLYPLAPDNKWTYKSNNGSTWTNAVTGNPAPGTFTMQNSLTPNPVTMKMEGNDYLTDAFEAGNFQVMLKEGLKAGDTWEIHFTANTINSILVMTVKEAGMTKEVEGKSYADVVFIEAESKMNMNGNVMALNFFTQYYYAPGTGLILTTSSAGDSHSLVSAELH